MARNIANWQNLRRRPPYLVLTPKIFKRGLKFPIIRTINSTIFGLLMINHTQGLMSIENKSYSPSKQHPSQHKVVIELIPEPSTGSRFGGPLVRAPKSPTLTLAVPVRPIPACSP